MTENTPGLEDLDGARLAFDDATTISGQLRAADRLSRLLDMYLRQARSAEPTADQVARYIAHHGIPAAVQTGAGEVAAGTGERPGTNPPHHDHPDGTRHLGCYCWDCPADLRESLARQHYERPPAPGAPQLDAEDVAVTQARKVLGGNLHAGLMPGTEIGGIQVTTWRERGALQVDVLLEDADGTAWTLDAGYLDIVVTIAGQAVHQGSHELPNACTRCGDDTSDGKGYGGLCGNCADRDEATRETARKQAGDGG